jgi:hypothetical protein
MLIKRLLELINGINKNAATQCKYLKNQEAPLPCAQDTDNTMELVAGNLVHELLHHRETSKKQQRVDSPKFKPL